jgi:hypothetical protein
MMMVLLLAAPIAAATADTNFSAQDKQYLEQENIPLEDYQQVRVTPEGDILYVEPAEPVPAREDGTPYLAPQLPIPVDEVFLQHCNPGATNTLYLDFNGKRIENSHWNKNADVHEALPMWQGIDPTIEELGLIYNIWQRVCDDWAIFDVDVTTEEPVVYDTTVGVVLITKSLDAEGICIYYCTPGGMAWLNKFGRDDYHELWAPALVFCDNVGNCEISSYMGEVSSHEFGHTVGLSHDGIIDGASYFQGEGSVLSKISWAPIMGVGYYRNITKWDNCTYPECNNPEEDLDIIAGHLGYAPDTFDKINNSDDVDSFEFDIPQPGLLEILVTPTWSQYEEVVLINGRLQRGSNLDIMAVITDENMVATYFSEPEDTLAMVSMQVTPGRYTLSITGIGNEHSNEYASHGYYYYESTFTPDAPPPPPPPENELPVSVITYTPADLTYRKGRGLRVIFDGRDSFDPDGDIVSYRWKRNAQLVSTTSRLSVELREGTYTYNLTVTDNDGGTDTTYETITVVRVKGGGKK